MSECPNIECHKKLEDLANYVYGVSGAGSGLMGKIHKIEMCAAKKMPRIWVWWFIAAFGVAIITGGYNLFYKAEAGDLKFETKAHAQELHDNVMKQCQENALRSRINEDRYIQIRDDLTEIKGMMKVLFRKINKDED